MSLSRDAKVSGHSAGSKQQLVKNVSATIKENNDDLYATYKNDHRNAGLVVIFNQDEFDGKEDLKRDGAKVDAENLKRVFKLFGFEVWLCENYTTAEIEKKLSKVSSNHENNNCLIVVMMSHGDEEKQLLTRDSFIKVDSLWEPFTSHRCKSLCGKPKLFFIQACRGSLPDFGSRYQMDLEEEEEKTMAMKSSSDVEQNIPIMADILIMFSSADGYPSFRDREYGSWFIEALCKMFRAFLNDKREMELMTILNAVNRYVAFNKEARDPNDQTFRHKQMPVIMSMLTKTFIFNKNHIDKNA